MSMVHDQLAGLDPDRLARLATAFEEDPAPILSYEAFEAVTKLYWVSAWKHETEPAGPSMWCFSQTMPYRVPNPTMYWRRPTYQEALTRQACYLASIGIETPWWPGVSEYWDEYIVKRAGHFNMPGRRYR